MAGMYAAFGTDKSKEKEGVWIDYGSFQVKVAYAGPGNTKFTRYSEEKLKPLRTAMQAGTIDEARSMHVLMDIYAKTIVLDWQIQANLIPDSGVDEGDEDTMIRGIEGPNSTVLDFNAENVLKTFKALPQLFLDIKNQAEQMVNFRNESLEQEAGN